MYRRGQDACFLTLRDEITLHGCWKDCKKLLNECTGHKSLDEVRTSCGLDVGGFDSLFTTMSKFNLIVDASQVYQGFHQASEYPSLTQETVDPKSAIKLARSKRRTHLSPGRSLPTSTEVGPLEILRMRKSTRCFTGEPLSGEELGGLLQAMYGFTGIGRPIPSAGGLYPLRLIVALLKPTASYRVGVYEYVAEKNALAGTKVALSPETACMLLDSRIPSMAAVLVFLVADMSRPVQKYANRAYRFALLEAGHVAQNAYFYCNAHNIGVIECGAFNDSQVEQELGLKKKNLTLTTLVVGRSHDGDYTEPYEEESWRLRSSIAKRRDLACQTKFISFRRGKYLMPRYAAYAEYSSADPRESVAFHKYNRANGCGLTLHETVVKALGEAIERRSTGLVRIDASCRPTELNARAIDLCQIAPLQEEYIKRAGLKKCGSDEMRDWVRGNFLTNGEEVFVPVDQIFYPLYPWQLSQPLTYHGSSTGVAAHFVKEKATEAAFLELIERDAIAVNWYARRRAPLVGRKCWDHDLETRIAALEKHTGSRVRFIDLTLDTVPVTMCVIKSHRYPHLVTGSSAALCFREAMSKSLDEAELMLHTLKRAKTLKRTELVTGVMDHARLWANREWAKKLDWMWSGGDSLPSMSKPSDLQQATNLFGPAVFELGNHKENAGLHVIRVVSEVLMPITFGYGAEHYRHPRLSMLGFVWAWSYPATPHCLA